MRHFKHFGIALAAAAAVMSAIRSAEAQRVEQGSLLLEDVPAPEPGVPQSLPAFLAGRSAEFVDWLANGSLLVRTRFGDTIQLHRLRAPLGAREQLTFFADGVVDAAAQPGGDALALLRDRGGGAPQIDLLHVEDQSLIPLTEGAYLNSSPLWAHDGHRIAFASNRRNGTDDDVYIADTQTPSLPARLIGTTGGGRADVLDWSPDDRRLLVRRTVTPTASTLAIATPDSGESRVLDLAAPPPEAPAPRRRSRKEKRVTAPAAAMPRVASARFAPDGRGVLVLSDAEGEFQRLRYVDPEGSATHDLTPTMDHDVELFDESSDGHYLAYVYNDDRASRLALTDQQRKLELAVSGLPEGVIRTLKFDPTGHRLALTVATADSPADVFVLDLDSMAVTRWTASERGPVDGAHPVRPARVSFATWDRLDSGPRELPAYVYRPGSAGTHPVVVWLSAGQHRGLYDPFVQYLVQQLGFAVVAPNVRGSSGYGRRFTALGAGALRSDAVRDVGALLVWLGLQRDFDARRVLLVGAGAGGLLALDSLAQFGDRVRGAVDLAGPVPMNSAAAITRPLLIVQALNDGSAPALQTQQFLLQVRAQKVEASYIAARNESGPYVHAANRDAAAIAVASFLVRYARP
jgi:dipeptidyl aminopeptidase/acylaminoacyl peptidase